MGDAMLVRWVAPEPLRQRMDQPIGPRLRRIPKANSKGSNSPYKFLESRIAVVQSGCETRAFKVLACDLKRKIAVIPMPHSRIFETGSQFRAH